MPVGDLIRRVYGVGGADASKPNGNVVESHVVTADDGTVQTVEVRDGAGVATGATYVRTRDLVAERAEALPRLLAQALDGLQQIIDTADVGGGTLTAAQLSAAARQTQTAVKFEAQVLRRLVRLVGGVLDGVA